jgi:hypothetical protein
MFRSIGNTKFTIWLFASGVVLVCTGCPSTKFRYEQVLNFSVFDPDPAAIPHATYGGGYALYKIVQIDNSERTTPFYFKVNKLYTGLPSDVGWNVAWQHHVIGASWRAGNENVPAGGVLNGIGCVAVGSPGISGPYFDNLNYSSSSGESVLPLLDTNQPPQFKGTAYPHDLAQACQ